MWLVIAFVPLVLFFVLYAVLKCVQRWTFTPYSLVSSPSAAPSDRTHALTLLQMNVFWRPTLLHMFKDEYVRERAALLSGRLLEFDIVCLNEAFHFGSSVVRDFTALIKQYDFHYVVSSRPVPLLSKQVIDSGLLIISKYPIIATDSVRYSDGTSYDAFCAKGCLYAKVQVDRNSFVHVFATHLQASYGGVTARDFEVRVNQSKTLRNFIVKMTSADDSPIFLLGDMNIDSIGEQDEYQTLIKTLTIPGYSITDTLRVKGHPVTIADFRGGELVEDVLTQDSDRQHPKSIDYVFIYESDNRTVVDSYEADAEPFPVQGSPYKQLSDHTAVRCRVTLRA
jgi:sphingomyelin phosphodiesterase